MDGPDDRLSVEWIVDAQSTPATAELALDESAKRRRIWSVRAGALLLAAALLAAGTWYATRPGPPVVVTFAGVRVDNATTVITEADTTFRHYVRTKHGALSARSRCYFDRVGGHTKTDVSNALYCGPVLFYRGAAPVMYLQITLVAAATRNGRLRLGLLPLPELPTPVALTSAANLERPDHRKPPTGAAGVVAPGPPPAATNTLVEVAQADLPKLTKAPATAVIGALNIGVELKASGFVRDFGQGSAEQSAPPGYRLLGFELNLVRGEAPEIVVNNSQPTTLQVSIDGGPARYFPPSIYGGFIGEELTRFMVAAVPSNARTVDLQLTDAGVTQSLSLLTGAPAAGNVEVLQHSAVDRSDDQASGGIVTAEINVNGRKVRSQVDVEEYNAYLGYFDIYGDDRASAPDRALLSLSQCASSKYFAGPQYACLPLSASLLSLTPTGGKPIAAHEYAGEFIAFDVPANFTSGTITLSGTGTVISGTRLTITTPFRIPISFVN